MSEYSSPQGMAVWESQVMLPTRCGYGACFAGSARNSPEKKR